MLRSGTSIGANIVEANGAISKDNFSAKMSISYKEALETKYWLDLLKDSGYLESKGYDELYQEADEISRMLFEVLKVQEELDQLARISDQFLRDVY